MHEFVLTWVLLAVAAPGRGYEGPLTASSTAPAARVEPVSEAKNPPKTPVSGNREYDNLETSAADTTVPDDLPDEEVPSEDVPVEEIASDDTVYVGETRREIIVSANLLGGGTRMDAFRQAGGRSVLELAGAKDVGYTTVAAALDRASGVRSVEDGASALGSNTLNVGVRGTDPRLSRSATVMLDEVPIAPAPYGQPELSLFPISIFSIARVDTVRGGSSVRFGPRTTGGVINLISAPIPENPTISVFAHSDQFGDAGVATSYGATHKKLGMYFEYAPRFGKTYRENSEFQAHSGLIKFAFPAGKKVDFLSTTHLSWERRGLPGGLDEAQYAEDRYQSERAHDRFDGRRVGTSIRMRVRPNDKQEFQTIGFYNHTLRMSVMRNEGDANEPTAVRQYVPRTYDVLGLEPRYTLRIDSPKAKLFQDFTTGARVMYEIALDQKCYDPLSQGGSEGQLYELIYPERPSCLEALQGAEVPSSVARYVRRDNDGRYAAYAFFVEDKLYLLDTRLVLTGGIRFEFAKLGLRKNVERESNSLFFWTPAPATSIWYALADQVAIFAGYGHSFGVPSFKQAAASDAAQAGFLPERAHQLESGIKLMELGGIYADLTGWHKRILNLTDPGENSVDVIQRADASGVEADVTWAPGDVWEQIEGLEFNLGYAWTHSRVVQSNSAAYNGNTLAWYPGHETWGSLEYAFDWGLKLGTYADYRTAQFTDYSNIVDSTEISDSLLGGGRVGQIPGYALWGAFIRLRRSLPRNTRIEFTIGVKNILNTAYFSRSDDTNGGILAQRPRTFYANLGFAHEFRRDARKARAARRKRKQGAGVRHQARVAERSSRRLVRGGAQL